MSFRDTVLDLDEPGTGILSFGREKVDPVPVFQLLGIDEIGVHTVTGPSPNFDHAPRVWDFGDHRVPIDVNFSSWVVAVRLHDFDGVGKVDFDFTASEKKIPGGLPGRVTFVRDDSIARDQHQIE